MAELARQRTNIHVLQNTMSAIFHPNSKFAQSAAKLSCCVSGLSGATHECKSKRIASHARLASAGFAKLLMIILRLNALLVAFGLIAPVRGHAQNPQIEQAPLASQVAGPTLTKMSGSNVMEIHGATRVQWLENEPSIWSIDNPTGRELLCYVTFVPRFGPDLAGKSSATLLLRLDGRTQSFGIRDMSQVSFTINLHPGMNQLNLSIIERGVKTVARADQRNLLVLAAGPTVTGAATWSASSPLGSEVKEGGKKLLWLGGDNEVLLDCFSPKQGEAILTFSATRGPAAPLGLCLMEVHLARWGTQTIDVQDGQVRAMQIRVPAGHSVVRMRSLPRPLERKTAQDKRPLVVAIWDLDMKLPK